MGRKRVLPKGMWERKGVYYARFRAGGRLIRKRLSTDLRAATEVLNELRARADKADFNLLDNEYPVESLKDQWLRHCEQALRPMTVKRYRENLAQILPKLPGKQVRQITADVVTVYRQDRLQFGASPRTVNMEVGALSTMLAWGVKHRVIGSNPVGKIKPLPTDTKAKNRRPLTVDEVERLFAHSPDYLKPVWRMFMTTGIRHDELVEMKFHDVDFERRVVTVQAHTAKNHKSREIPLDDEMLATIAELRDRAKHRQPVAGNTAKMTAQQAANFSRDHVFVSQVNTPLRNNLLRKFYGVCKRAGIEGAERGGSVDIHSLRVTFTTMTIDCGASPKAVQSILGHATLDMTMKVYAKATEKAKRDAISVLPFAKASTPEHVLSVQIEHSARTSGKNKPQTKPGKRVKKAN